MKQSIIIYKIYKQDLVVWNRVYFSINGILIVAILIPAILFQIRPHSEILHAL